MAHRRVPVCFRLVWLCREVEWLKTWKFWAWWITCCVATWFVTPWFTALIAFVAVNVFARLFQDDDIYQACLDAWYLHLLDQGHALDPATGATVSPIYNSEGVEHDHST